MFNYDLFSDMDLSLPPKPEEQTFVYKCIYASGKEVLINADTSSSDFIKCEKKSPDLKEIWKQINVSKWEKIFSI